MVFKKLKKLLGGASAKDTDSPDELDLEAEAALAEDEDDEPDYEAETTAEGADEIAAAAQAIADAQAAAVADPSATAEYCSYERFVELQTLVSHWTQQGIRFEEQMRRAGITPQQWTQVNAYWAPKSQDPANQQIFWAVRERTMAQLASGAYGEEEPDLVPQGAAGPVGLSWTRIDRPFGSIEVPAGPKWQVVEKPGDALELQSNHYQTAVVLQLQRDVPASAREGYVDSFIQVNMRDAPGYTLRGKTLGRVGGRPAAQVDGEFQAAIHFATRDYVVFFYEMALMLMVRGPVANTDWVHSLADHLAGSLR